MKMHDRIEVRIPYPIRIFGLNVAFKRKIGFSFTNLSIFLFREANKLETSEDYNNWLANNGEEKGLISEMLYYAAKAYSMEEKRAENFTKEGIQVAITMAPKAMQEEIMGTWRESQVFGLKSTEKKKVRKKPKPKKK